MKDLARLLRDGDPASDDHTLAPLQADAMRRVVVDAARGADAGSASWQRPLPVIALVVLTVAAGAIAGSRIWDDRWADAPSVAPAVSSETRQLQFSTPGGTRIIWVFDPEFELKETLP